MLKGKIYLWREKFQTKKFDEEFKRFLKQTWKKFRFGSVETENKKQSF